MLVRLVEATVRSGSQADLEAVYRNDIIPKLEETDGCLFAGLLQSLDGDERFLSLTLWDSGEQARRYVDSGAFQDNLDRAKPYLEASAEWKIQLSRDDTLEYAPVSQEPAVKSYPVGPPTKPLPTDVATPRSFLRVLSLKLKPDRQEEFRDIYEREIQPEVEQVPGCRYAFLVENSEVDQEMLSFTIWDDLKLVEDYEQNGVFQELFRKVQHTLGELYQWKVALEGHSTAQSVTSEDIGISKSRWSQASGSSDKYSV